MEEFKAFVIAQLSGNRKRDLFLAISLPIISVGFWWWFFGINHGASIVVPKIFAIMFLFGPFIGLFCLYRYLRSRHPERNAVYKLLFETPEEIKNFRIQRSYYTYIFLFNLKKSYMPKTFTVVSKSKAEIFLRLMKEYLPEVQVVK